MGYSRRIKPQKNNVLITYTHPDSIISEQYRMIEANIKFSMDTMKSRAFLITSPSSGEGKSTSAANLAVTMALNNEKVLLIDANFSNPVMHTVFNVPNSPGLTDILNNKSAFYEAVHHTGIAGLDILASGRMYSNIGTQLDSNRMQSILNSTLHAYDVILIDSHSILDLTDTKLLASQCDGVVLVLKKGKTSLSKAAQTRKVLEFAKANLVGVIFNE
ncbi:CpsD/CapB family tyrosine-protein kinase [Heyndrickxia acidicola]|uniref:non-specific protein-tyrosine kinase n=1 Tax=Heyndrickxia acidicola TaxID=209389 RepID=A0ABU6MKY7_9BACI|nr:CpsD/CapB family tyrosine-protein kinase [Heyndrickxia acidicola]MED1205190.1 CpsD/CapB family tyrosine-protein kinase [Heyndrickxia acidicola]